MAHKHPDNVPYHIDHADKWMGMEIGSSSWVKIEQETVDKFGAATHDMNPMHVDPEWATKNSPFGGPIAHGFLTLSMLSHLAWGAELQPEGVDYGINLGFERVRFLAPVMVDDRIRMRASMVECKPRGDDRWSFKSRVTIETEKTKKAAVSAIWLVLFVRDEEAGRVMGQMG